MKRRKSRLVSVFVDQHMLDMMLATRAQTGRSLSAQVRLAVDTWLQREGGRLFDETGAAKATTPRIQRRKKPKRRRFTGKKESARRAG
jgi:hypothetical protein